MLESAKMMGFVGTTDYDRSRQFYEDKLGWKILSTDSFAMVAEVGGHMVRIVKIPNFAPAKSTVLGWEVDDVVPVVDWLQSQGVEVEHYPWVQDPSGIWTAPNGDKVAWFKDPDGNVLSISKHVNISEA